MIADGLGRDAEEGGEVVAGDAAGSPQQLQGAGARPAGVGKDARVEVCFASRWFARGAPFGGTSPKRPPGRNPCCIYGGAAQGVATMSDGGPCVRVAFALALVTLAGCLSEPDGGTPGATLPADAPAAAVPPASSPPATPADVTPAAAPLVPTPAAPPTTTPAAAAAPEEPEPASPSDPRAFHAFRASYATADNGTVLTLDLSGPARTMASDGRMVQAYVLRVDRERKDLSPEVFVHWLSAEGRLVKTDAKRCEVDPHRCGPHAGVRVVDFSGEGGVPPYGVLWPQIIAREGNLTSWAYGRATELAAGADRTGTILTVNASVPPGQTRHGTAGETFQYAHGRPVPVRIEKMDLRAYAAGPELSGADAHRPPTLALAGRSSPLMGVDGADGTHGLAPLTIADVMRKAAAADETVRDAPCLHAFSWQALGRQGEFPSPPDGTMSMARIQVSKGNASYATLAKVVTHASSSDVTFIPAPATSYGVDVCAGLREAASPARDPWEVVAFAQKHLPVGNANVSGVGFNKLGLWPYGTPPADGWLVATASFYPPLVHVAWNPATGRFTDLRGPGTFFDGA